MALIKCIECGHDISDKATSCPNCGCPVRFSLEQQEEANQQIITEINPELTEAVQKYDSLGGFDEGLARVKKGDLWGFINQNGEEVIPCRYDGAGFFSEGLAAVKKGDLCGFINQNGEEVIPCRYDRVWPFSEGLALVRIADKWGYVDKEGNSTFTPN